MPALLQAADANHFLKMQTDSIHGQLMSNHSMCRQGQQSRHVRVIGGAGGLLRDVRSQSGHPCDVFKPAWLTEKVMPLANSLHSITRAAASQGHFQKTWESRRRWWDPTVLSKGPRPEEWDSKSNRESCSVEQYRPMRLLRWWRRTKCQERHKTLSTSANDERMLLLHLIYCAIMVEKSNMHHINTISIPKSQISSRFLASDISSIKKDKNRGAYFKAGNQAWLLVTSSSCAASRWFDSQNISDQSSSLLLFQINSLFFEQQSPLLLICCNLFHVLLITIFECLQSLLIFRILFLLSCSESACIFRNKLQLAFPCRSWGCKSWKPTFFVFHWKKTAVIQPTQCKSQECGAQQQSKFSHRCQRAIFMVKMLGKNI